MSKNNQISTGHQGQTPQPVSANILEEIIGNQTRDLQLRSQELELRQQHDKNAFDFSKSALGAQAQDRKDQREHQFKQLRLALLFSGVICLAVIGMVVFALAQGKDAFATEIFKAIVFALTGGAGGYGLAQSKTRGGSPQSKHDTRS